MEQSIIKILILCIGQLLVRQLLIAQQPTYRTFNGQDGLPTSAIYDILEDEKGYIWIGTEQGLFKYNGIQMKELEQPDQKKRSLSNLQLDQTGRIWANDFHGQLYYVAGGQLHALQEQIDTLSALKIRNYLVTDRIVWIPISRGIVAYNLTNDTRTDYYFPDQKTFRTVDIIQRKNGLIYLLTDEGLIWQLYKDHFQLVTQIPTTNEEEEFRFFESSAGELYLFDRGTTTSQFIYKHIVQDSFEYLPISYHTRITDMYEDTQRNIWVSTFKGVWGYTSNFELLKEVAMPLLQNHLVSSIQQDFEGSYWISTLYSGLFYTPSINMVVYDQAIDSFPDNRISSLAKTGDHTLYVGFNNGSILTLTNQELVNIQRTDTRIEINEMLYDEETQILWVSSDYLYGFLKGQPTPSILGIGGSVKDIAKVQSGIFFVGTANYTHLFSLQDNLQDIVWSDHYTIVPDPKFNKIIPIRKKRCRAIVNNQQSTDKVWVAYSDGLYYLTPTEQKIMDFQGNAILAISLVQSADGILWAGTEGSGIYAIQEDRIIGQYDISDGLHSNFVKKITTLEESTWLVSEKGIQQFNPSSKVFSTINQYDGLKTNEITDVEIMDSIAWIATPKGLHRCDLRQLPIINPPPKLYISGFSIWEKDTVIQLHYELPHDLNNIKITLDGLSYRSGRNLNYQYRLKGLNDDWINVPAINNTIRYPSLRPGNYQFEAKIINAKGTESEENVHITLQIKAPYWQTPLFLISLMLLIAFSIYAVFSKIIQNIRKKAQLEKALRNSQLSALKAQMNPHFLFNAMNSIQDFILTNDKRQANAYLGKFANLMRMILEMSNEEVVCLFDELHALQLYLDLEVLRLEEAFLYDIKTASIPIKQLYIPPMLIQPHVENAIKHGLFHASGLKRLSIQIEQQTALQQLKCTIEDNGVGRTKARSLRSSHKKFGQQSTFNRLELLNKGRQQKISQQIIDLVDEKGGPIGTKVVLLIPYYLNSDN